MKVTIITDASLIIKTQQSGYGFYIGCSAGKIQKAGKLKAKTKSIDQSELHCIANALYTLKYSKFKPISKVWIWCDNLPCVNAISGLSRGYTNPEMRKVIDEIHFLMMEICLRENRSIRDIENMFVVQHIKGHTGNSDKLSKIQEWCDLNARSYARNNKASKSVKLKQNHLQKTK